MTLYQSINFARQTVMMYDNNLDVAEAMLALIAAQHSITQVNRILKMFSWISGIKKIPGSLGEMLDELNAMED